MQDRISENPGRVLITPENGPAYYATMTRADNPTQNGTPLNKASLLKDATAALFGFGADAVPDDVFGVLSRFQSGLGNEYVWAKVSNEDVIVRSVVDSATKLQMWNLEASKYLNYTYSNGVSADENGNIVLEGVFAPSKTPSNSNINYWDGLMPFYIDIEGSIYRITQSNSSAGNYVTISGFLQEVKSETIAANKVVGYVNSPDPNAYPIDDGFTYTALGQLGSKVQIATGNYTGTGATSKTITNDFVAKLLFVAGQGSNNRRGFAAVICGVGGFSTTVVQYTASTNQGCYGVNSTVSENSVTLSGPTEYLFNASGVNYTYMAIG